MLWRQVFTYGIIHVIDLVLVSVGKQTYMRCELLVKTMLSDPEFLQEQFIQILVHLLQFTSIVNF